MTEETIKQLDELWAKAKTEVDETDNRTYILQNEVANSIEDICWKYLIKADELDWNRKNVEKIKEYGYKCYAGEKDSFGMLTAVVEKNGVRFCFG
jgi:hypothetical protein